MYWDLYFACDTARGFMKADDLGFPEHKAIDFFYKLQSPQSFSFTFFFLIVILVLDSHKWKLQESLWETMSSDADILHQKKALFSEPSLCYQWHHSTSMSVGLYE